MSELGTYYFIKTEFHPTQLAGILPGITKNGGIFSFVYLSKRVPEFFLCLSWLAWHVGK